MMTQPPTTETTRSNLKHANNQTLLSPSLNLLQTHTQHTHIFINTYAHTHRHTPLYNYDKLYNYPLCSTVSQLPTNRCKQETYQPLLSIIEMRLCSTHLSIAASLNCSLVVMSNQQASLNCMTVNVQDTFCFFDGMRNNTLPCKSMCMLHK